jgi:hypothetical protein
MSDGERTTLGNGSKATLGLLLGIGGIVVAATGIQVGFAMSTSRDITALKTEVGGLKEAVAELKAESSARREMHMRDIIREVVIFELAARRDPK